MAGLLRGTVIWANLDPVIGHEQAGHRPVLVISHQRLNERSGTVIALAITSAPPRFERPFNVPLPSSCGLPRPSWAKAAQIRTISTQRLGAIIGQVDEPTLADILTSFLEHIA